MKKTKLCSYEFFYSQRHQLFILPELISLVFTFAVLPFLFTEITKLPLDSIISAFNPFSVHLLFNAGKKGSIFLLVIAIVTLVTRTISVISIILNKTKITKFILYIFQIVDLLFVIAISLFFTENGNYHFVPSEYVVIIINFFAFFYSMVIPLILNKLIKLGIVKQ